VNEILQGTKNHTTPAILPSKFNSHKIQNGGAAILKFTLMVTIRLLLIIVAQNWTQRLETTSRRQFYLQISLLRKSQDGGGRHFENWFKGYISDNMAYICMKFCKRTKNGVPQSILL